MLAVTGPHGRRTRPSNAYATKATKPSKGGWPCRIRFEETAGSPARGIAFDVSRVQGEALPGNTGPAGGEWRQH